MEHFLNSFRPFYWASPQRTSQDRLIGPDPENGILMEGFLFKRAGNALKTWQRRWFQVYHNQLLYVKGPKTEPRVVLEDLRQCTVQPFSTNRHRFCFKVVSPTKSYMLAADSEGTRLEWTRAINNAALVSQPRPDDSEQWSHQEQTSAPGSPDLRESSVQRVTPACNDLESNRTGTPLVQNGSSPTTECIWTKYILGKKLGKGGFGSVYEGVCKADGRQVAIKCIHKQADMKYIIFPGEADPIPSEVALMLMVSQSPRCKNIIELLDWYDHPKYLILVLEKPSPCMDLTTFIEDGPLSEDVAQLIMVQVVLAMIHCSSRGVLHRDIKTENILVNPYDFHAKVIDFGCGDLLKNTPYREFAGTWFNIPPEMIIYHQYYGCAATVWSLGILLYDVLCGDLPFKTEKQILEGDLHFTRDLSAACCDLIRRCLAKEPEDRPSLWEILGHEWFWFSN